MIRRDVVIVGAGPAGLSAALTLAERGLRPTLIDENPAVGGQIYRQTVMTSGTGAIGPSSADGERGQQLRRRMGDVQDKIELLTDTMVWGIFGHKQVAVKCSDGWQMIQATHLMLATGAYEYVCPFPGWTLSGVMTPGGAQSMIKSMGVRPGKRVLVAGSGPFLLVVAGQLQEAGVEVVGVVEAVRRRDMLRHIGGLLACPAMLRQGWQYIRALKQNRVPLLWGHVVTRARGEGLIREVEIAPCDQQWRPVSVGRRTVEVDTLCVGYGFVPRSELASLSGCRMRYADELGGWIPEVDANLQTSVDGVWVAGDGAGVAGSVVAEAEGTLVGLRILAELDQIKTPDLIRTEQRVRARLATLRRFRRALDQIYHVRAGLDDLATKETIVCRCEELTLEEVEAAAHFGGTTQRSLKVMTRLGMGPCQGRMCWPAMARRIACQTGKRQDAVGPISVRPPAVPLTIGDLLNESNSLAPHAAEALRVEV